MSNQNPVQTMFDFQRSALESSQRLTHQTVDAQKTMMNAFADSVEAAEDVSEQNVRITYEAVHRYVDALEDMLPEESDVEFDQFREAADEQFDAYGEIRADTWEAVHEATRESAENFEEFADEYVDTVDSSFDAFLEVHEEVESHTVEAAEEFEAAAEEIDVTEA